MHNRPVLDQDFLRRIANYDNSAVKQLIQTINDDIDQLCALFKRPDFSLEAITALIQTINADTACIMSDDNFKDDRANIRKRLTNGIEAAMQAVSYKNYELSRDALNIIMDKKTGLAILQGGIMKKTSMQRLEAIRNNLNKLIKERDENLLSLIHAENLEEVKRIINAGGKVDWAIFLKGKKIDFTKGPVKTLVDLIKDDMVALVEGLHTDNVNNLIVVVNQKTRYFSDDAKFRLAREDMVRFFCEKILRLNFFVKIWHPKEYLKDVNAVLEALDLVRWNVDVPQRGTLSALLYNAQISLKGQLETINSQLMDAIKKGNLEGVNRAIFNGADINHVGQLGKTPLRLAVLSGGQAIVDRLLYMGADLSDVSHAIRDAVGLSRYDIADSLIIKGINIINEKRNTQDSLVKWVAENKYVRLFLMLLNRGVEIDWTFIKANVDESGVSFLRDQLIESMSLDLLDIVKNDNKLAFINAAQRKLNLLKAESDNPFVLLYVSKEFLVEALSRHYYAFDSEATAKFQQLLIGLGVDPKTMGLEAPRPVVLPESKPEPELEPVVDSSEFFDSGELVVDLEAKDAEGYTPLMNAARFGRVNEAKALLNAGVTIDWLAFLWKLRQDYGLLSMYQRANVYPLLTLLSFDDIDALVGSSGAEDTDHLIEKLNNQTSPMYDPGYDNRFRRGWIRNKLVTVFKEKNELDSNPGLSKVLDKVLAKLLIIQGKGSKNGIKTAMHELQLLSKKLASQHQGESVVENKSEDMSMMPPLMSGSSFDDFAEVTSLTDVSNDKARAASRSIREAITLRDLDKLKSLIDENPECIDRPDIDGFPPLLAAALENKGYYVIDMTDEILPYLIQRGAQIDWDAFSAVEPAMFNSFRQLIIYFLSSVVHGEIKELFKFESEDAVQALIKRINEKTQHLDIDVGSIARANIRTNFIFQLHQKKQEVMVSKDVSFLTSTLKYLDYIAREMHIIQRTARNVKYIKRAMYELKLWINTMRAAIGELNFQALLHLTNAEAINTKINAMNEEISSLDTLDIKHLREEISPSFIDILKKRRADFSNVIAEPVLQSAHDCFNQVLNELVIIQSSDERAMNAVRKNLNSLIEHLKGRLDKLAGVDKLPAGHRPTVFRDATDQEKKDRKEQFNTGFNDTNIFGL